MQLRTKEPVSLTADVTGTLPVANGGTNATTWTAGSVVFASTASAFGQDNTNLFWDDANNWLGIGTASPTVTLDVHSTSTIFISTRDVAGDGFNKNSFILQRDNAFGGGTPTNNDRVAFSFREKQADGTYALLAAISGGILDVTNNTATGVMYLAAKASGNPASVFAVDTMELTAKGFGYTTGVCGAVTQQNNKTTGVTLNTVGGQITMNGAALAAGASVIFTLTNSVIATGDLVLVCTQAAAATANTYSVLATDIAAGSCGIRVTNYSGSSRSQAIIINFVVFKAYAA